MMAFKSLRTLEVGSCVAIALASSLTIDLLGSSLSRLLLPLPLGFLVSGSTLRLSGLVSGSPEALDITLGKKKSRMAGQKDIIEIGMNPSHHAPRYCGSFGLVTVSEVTNGHEAGTLRHCWAINPPMDEPVERNP